MQARQDGELDALLVRLSRLHLGSTHLMDQLGLLYVGTYATGRGYRVRVLDQANMPVARLTEIVAASAAQVVGFYVDHENVHATMTAIRVLKEANPEVLFVTGGPQVSVPPWDERLILEGECDVAVRGEGEFAFTAVLDWYLKRDGLLQEIEGITFLEGGQVVRTIDRQLCADPDIFPVPDRNLNYERRKPDGTDYIVTSRGCPHHCAFCYEGSSETAYRPRQVQQVLAEVEMLLKTRRPTYINILDDTFTVDAARVEEFCAGMRRLHERYYPVKWFCEGRANVIVKHPEMMRQMVSAGLDRIQLGVETGNQHVLDAYRKNLTLDEIREAVRICCDADLLSIFGNFIIGGAFESWETIDRSIEFAKELLSIGLGRLEVNSTIYTPYPGTAMYNQPEQFGMEILDLDCVSGPGDNYAFVRTAELSKWEILHARQRFIEAVSKKMTELFWQVPDRLLQRHCEAYYKNGLKTNWFQLTDQIFNYSKYFSLPLVGDYKHLGELPPDAVDEHKPVRTVFIGASHDGKLFLDLGNKKLKLNDTASMIMEQCYGKLCTREIIDATWKMRFPEAPREVAREMVHAFLAQMDREKLLVFTSS